MAAPIGNQFWKLRSKHGRELIFTNPDIMWEAAEEYFLWCQSNPLMETVVQKRKINRDEEIIELIEVPKVRAFTMQGLCLYLRCNVGYFNDFERKENKDFSEVITRIKETVFTQKFTNAAAGFLNANLIARELGISDKSSIDHSGELSVTQITGMQIK